MHSGEDLCDHCHREVRLNGTWTLPRSDIKHCQVESNVVLFNAAISAAEKVALGVQRVCGPPDVLGWQRTFNIEVRG